MTFDCTENAQVIGFTLVYLFIVLLGWLATQWAPHQGDDL